LAFFTSGLAFFVHLDLGTLEASARFAMVFMFTKESTLFCQFMLHSSQSMIRVTLW